MELNHIGSMSSVVNNAQLGLEKVYSPKVDLSMPQDTVELSTKKNKKKKAIIAAAVVTAAIVAGAIAYKYHQHKIGSTTPKDLKDLFNKLKHKKGEDFVNSAYEGIRDHMNLTGIAPESVRLTDKADGIFNTITGGYNPIDNTIEYSKGFLTKLTKKQQFNLLSHELKHARQYSDAIRTEGIGIQRVAEAEVAKKFTHATVMPIGKCTKEQLEQLIEQEKASELKLVLEKLKQNHAGSLNAPKIAAKSAEGIQAAKYIEAIKKYEGLMFGIGGKEYRENLLEVEAYAFGDKMGEMFGTFQTIPSKISDIFRVILNSSKK